MKISDYIMECPQRECRTLLKALKKTTIECRVRCAWYECPACGSYFLKAEKTTND